MDTPIQYPNRAAALRAKLLGQAVAPSKPVVIGVDTYFIRTPLLDDRQRMLDLAGVKKPKPKKGKRKVEEEDLEVDVPLDAMMAAAAVILAVDDVGNPLFTPVDLDAIKKAPLNGWLAELARMCLETLTSGDKDGDVEGEQ